jgi:WD40 repeat protein
VRTWSAARFVIACTVGCGGHHAPAADGGAPPSAACQRAREMRTAAEQLDRGGHELLAKAKLDEANAACPGEKARSGDLEARVLADLGDCTQAAAVPRDGGADAGAACRERSAPSKGTDATMRAKMREAFAAEHAKDFARAEALYLDAWSERHPNPVAIEDAARMAGLRGDAARSRRLRDRALYEAETSEHAVAVVTNRVRASGGVGRLVRGTLTVADGGQVVARDANGELRALLDVPGVFPYRTTLSPLATIVTTSSGDATAVYDLLTGQRLFGGERVASAVASPDDALLFVDGSAGRRIVDVATGAVRATMAWSAGQHPVVVGFESNGDLVVIDHAQEASDVLRDWDVKKGTFGWLSEPIAGGYYGSVAQVSANGKYAVSNSRASDDGDLYRIVVRDLDSRKIAAQWTGNFFPVYSFDVTADGAELATGSRNSVRLWTVADHKQRFVATRTRRGDNFDDDLGAYAFADDGKTVVLARDRRTMLWDVATGKETEAVSDQTVEEVRRARPFGDGGMVFVLDDSVRVVPAGGDAHVLCRGVRQRYYPDVGPTNAVVSPSGKSLACSMSGGAVHVFDTTTWQERASFTGPDAGVLKDTGMRRVWVGVPPSERPVDLAFSPDDATLTVVGDGALFTFDASTGKRLTKVALRDPKLPGARRHARFADGRILVKTANGMGAWFDASGTYVKTMALVAGARLDAPDAFSDSGKTYAVVVGDVLHAVDLDTGEDRTTHLPVAGTAVALSADGKTTVVVGKDGSAYRVRAKVEKIETSGARRAFFVGAAFVVVTGRGDTLDLFSGDGAPRTLEVDPNGLVARGPAGAFEERGRAEAECVVGRVLLTQETCADRATKGLVAAWLGTR